MRVYHIEMTGAFIGVILMIAGLLTALGGVVAAQAIVGFVVLVALYLGFQPQRVGATLEILSETPIITDILGVIAVIPFLRELIAGLFASILILHIIAVGYGIAGGILPIAYGFHVGASTFGETAVGLIPPFIGLLFTLGLIATAPIALPAIIGGVLFGVGVQFTFSVADGSTAPFSGVAEWLQSDGMPEVVPDMIYAIGSIVESPLLVAVTFVVAVGGVAAQLLLFG
jgi:hypothetical protein